jgi:hypothetical protein
MIASSERVHEDLEFGSVREGVFHSIYRPNRISSGF